MLLAPTHNECTYTDPLVSLLLILCVFLILNEWEDYIHTVG